MAQGELRHTFWITEPLTSWSWEIKVIPHSLLLFSTISGFSPCLGWSANSLKKHRIVALLFSTTFSHVSLGLLNFKPILGTDVSLHYSFNLVVLYSVCTPTLCPDRTLDSPRSIFAQPELWVLSAVVNPCLWCGRPLSLFLSCLKPEQH